MFSYGEKDKKKKNKAKTASQISSMVCPPDPTARWLLWTWGDRQGLHDSWIARKNIGHSGLWGDGPSSPGWFLPS